MRALLLIFAIGLIGCATTMTGKIDQASAVVTGIRKGAKVDLNARCLKIARTKCDKTKKAEECPELMACWKVRRQIYTGASRIQTSLLVALHFKDIDEKRAKSILSKALAATKELITKCQEHGLLLEGITP